MGRGKPIRFRGLADRIRLLIQDRQLSIGMALPSERALAREFGANHLTVRKALKLLETEGVIHTVPSRGSYVGLKPVRKEKTGLLGFVFPDDEMFFYEILADLERKGEARGLHPLVHVTHQSPEKEARILNYFKGLDLAGVVAAPNVETLTLYKDLLCPVVFFDTIMEEESAPTVITDDTRGARLVTEHLIELGHRRIAHIGGLGDPTSHLRFNGYLDALNAHGMSVDTRLVKRRDYGREWGYYAVDELFKKVDFRPTALMCGNDTLAGGALRRIAELGLNCPSDVSVTGFGNTEIAAALDLTTVHQPREAIVDGILDNLRSLSAGKECKPLIRIKTEIILRASSTACRSAREGVGRADGSGPRRD